MNTIRKLEVSEDKCIGCQACTNTCPKGYITFKDNEMSRTVRFIATCAEECTRCADVCSEAAIALIPIEKAQEGYFSFEFNMTQCTCGKPFVPQHMVEKLHSSLDKELHPIRPWWLHMCMQCRQKATATQLLKGKEVIF